MRAREKEPLPGVGLRAYFLGVMVRRSEEKFQTELYLAAWIGGLDQSKGARTRSPAGLRIRIDYAVALGSAITVRRREDRRVGEVDELGHELQVEALGDVKTLGDVDVRSGEARSTERTNAAIPEG